VRAGALRAISIDLSDEETARLRRLAFRRGSVLERDGRGIYGFGEALRLPLPNGLGDAAGAAGVEASLQAIDSSAATRAVLAIGSLPFLPDAPASLTVPEVAVVVDGSAAGVALLVSEGKARRAELDRILDEAAGDVAFEPPPDAFSLTSTRSHADFLAMVQAAVDEIRTGRLDKVVLAREVRIEANRPLRQHDLLERLRSLHPSCLSFAVGGFVGATPELLISRHGGLVASHPLAGTAPRSGDPEADRRIEVEMLESEKERAEHRAVVEAIAEALAPFVAELDVPAEPHIVELRNVSHLGTRITGRLAAGSGGALGLLGAIHPTPAVAGSPTDVALEYIAKAEELDRDRYAGPVGWVDGSGDGEWHLGIRSAIVEGAFARLFAGVGIVADSDPAAELRETQLKLQAILAAAVRP
jgi:menaquinone-specific isochorismate synthase